MPTKHFRAPIFDTFRKESPFDGLAAHAGKIKECVGSLEQTLLAFIKGDAEATKEFAMVVSRLELEADEIKSNVRNHLPANVRMSVDKPLFLQALSEQDRILDEAEDAAIWMGMRKEKIPADIAAGFQELLAKVVETVDAYEKAVSNTHDLLQTGFVKRERDEEKTLIHRVHELEHETDVLSRALSAKLLDRTMEEKLGAVSVYHLLKLTLQISKIADHAENAGDRLRAMLSR